eukprot:GHVU01183052.1.p1 GENE.GHVU01183052.1~~GHVU01183052.1.p1  ORF type:complete len:104 (+),score=15.88 GHVU01183052.1:416-727(+)
MTAASTCGLTDNKSPARLRVYKGCDCENRKRISPDNLECDQNQFSDFYAVRGAEYLVKLSDEEGGFSTQVTTGDMLIQMLESAKNQKYFDAEGAADLTALHYE